MEKNFKTLVTLFREETDKETRRHILDVIKNLAEYHLQVWKQVGPGIQEMLANTIEKFTPEEAKELRPALLTVWRESLKSDMDATTMVSYDKMAITSSALPVFDGLKVIRKRAINGLIELLDKSVTEREKGQVLSALREATRPPGRADYVKRAARLYAITT